MSTVQDLIAQIDGLVQRLKREVASAGVVVTTAPELLAALQTGGAITIRGGTYAGNFVITQPTVLTGAGDALLTPLDLLAPTLRVPASDVTVTGIRIRTGAPDRECVVVGDPAATSAATQPTRVTLEHIAVEAGAGGGHRGIALHGMHLTVRRSKVTGFWEAGRDAQAIWISNGPGPYTLEDNYLEGSGETILVGGDTIRIPGCVPSDIVIRGNTCYKPESWRTNGATVKTGIELKVGRRVRIEHNVIDGNWTSGQVGTPILLTTRNQNGDTPWVVLDEVIVRGNRTVRCADGYCLSILGRDDGGRVSGQTQRVTIEGNLFADSTDGFLIGNGVATALIIRHNTLPGVRGSLIKFYASGGPIVRSPLTFDANVARSGAYGFTGDGTPVGLVSLATYTTGGSFVNNVIETTAERPLTFPPGNEILPPGGLAARLHPTTQKLLTGDAGY